MIVTPMKSKQKYRKRPLEEHNRERLKYISALLLIAPSLENGLTIQLQGKVTSKPYLHMTISLLHEIGVKTAWENNVIKVYPKNQIRDTTTVVESDWSSASYFYSVLALSKKGKLELFYLKENSLQGDRELASLYSNFGIQTTFNKNSIVLEKIIDYKQKKHISLDLVNTPDIAQTIAVTCFGLGVSCGLTGLHTLKIKETDRLEALKKELQKFDAKIRITKDSFHLKGKKIISKKQVTSIETYEDHRMAMAFAPLSLKFPLLILKAAVVNKSYPDFWRDFEFD